MPNIQPWTQKERLAREREVTGFYVTGHPLSKYEVDYKSFTTIRFGETEQLEEMDIVKACGVITSLKTKIDKQGRTMAFFTVDDFSGSCEALMFSKVYEQYGKYLKEEECVFIIGRPESSGDAIKIHIEKLIPIEEVRDAYTESIKIYLDKERHSAQKIPELKKILLRYKGNIPVFVSLINNGSKGRNFGLREMRVNVSNDFIRELSGSLGEDSLILYSKR